MNTNRENLDEWVIVLEFVPAENEAVEYGSLHALVEELGPWHPAALFSTDRYALQLNVVAERPADALRLGVSLHDRAVTALGFPRPELARLEILTDTEFASQCDDARGAGAIGPLVRVDTVLSNHQYSATRAMFRATSVSELTAILVRFVDAVGGHVEAGCDDEVPGRVSVDLSLEEYPRLCASADSFSVSGLIIEHSLPGLVADARAVMSRLRRRYSVSDKRGGPTS